MKLFTLSRFCLALLLPFSIAHAAETLPGDSCTAGQTNYLVQTSGPEVAGGGGHTLLCNGTVWQPLFSYNAAGVFTKMGNQTCATNEILKFNGTIWACAADGGGGAPAWGSITGIPAGFADGVDDTGAGVPALPSSQIFVGNAGGVATAVAMSGDATLSNAGVLTIANNAVGSAEITNAAVTYAKIQNVTTNRLLGRATTGAGVIEEITLGTGLSLTGTTLNATGTADNLGNHIATQSLVSDTTNTDDLGTTGVRWKDGWFAGTLTAGMFSGSGASLTALPAANLTGTLPALSGANLTNLNATNLASGTVAGARMPAFTGDVTVAAGTTTTAIAANAVTSAKTDFVGTLTEGKWCTVSSGKIVCTSDAPTGGAGGDAPTDCIADPNLLGIGTTCTDGSKFLGSHPVFSWQEWYATSANQTSSKWATVNQTNSGSYSLSNGYANQQWIVANRTLSQYPAFQVCENLVLHGKSDWYLPSKDELNFLYANASAIGGFGTGLFWSSSERSSNDAWFQNFAGGSQNFNGKSNTLGVRCVRRS